MQKENLPEGLRERLKRHLLGRLILRFASFFYFIITAIRKRLYEAAWLKSERLSIPNICIGNLSTGGTGKTPAIILLASLLLKANRKPAVLTRGYGRKAQQKKKKGKKGNKNSVIVISRNSIPTEEECGDEPLMLAKELAYKAPCMISANRYAAGTIAAFQYGCDIAIMDDGLQHFALRRDMNIILINATAPFTKDKLLPYGNLREPPSGLRRASAVIITHCELVSRAEITSLRAAIKKYTFAPIMESSHKPLSFIQASKDIEYSTDCFLRRKAAVLSGIANPESFEKNLKQLGADIKQTWRYPDHHHYTDNELISAKNAAMGLPIITTFKDFTRFPNNWRELIGEEVYLLKIALSLNKEDEEALLSMIMRLKAESI